ncbi:MAG: co-chaperone GroES [Candidatus Pacebacteria bacterium]|nr:co-chaperone GroES [Candidatus Paceibacterota bacterium]
MPKTDSSSGANLITGTISPLADRVVVKPITKEEKASASGIIIPETADKERPAKGTVVAVGPGKTEDGKLFPVTVKVGQTVLFSKYGYDEVKIDGEEYFILSESSILAVINK